MFKITLLFLWSLTATVYAPEAGSAKEHAAASVYLEGIVIDQETDEPLAGAKIAVKGRDIAVYSDLDGRFKIPELSAGTYAFEASYISYQDMLLPEVQLTPPKSHLTIALQP